ncbi:MAG: hypothetical protein ACLQKA_12885 [Bryobacteraceae bacterium]
MTDAAHRRSATRYVERNPVRAGMLADSTEYAWSSASAHLPGLDVTGMLDLPYWSARVGREEWRGDLRVTEESDELAAIRAKRRLGGRWAQRSL